MEATEYIFYFRILEGACPMFVTIQVKNMKAEGTSILDNEGEF
jgi:hypothetical protein